MWDYVLEIDNLIKTENYEILKSELEITGIVKNCAQIRAKVQ